MIPLRGFLPVLLLAAAGGCIVGPPSRRPSSACVIVNAEERAAQHPDTLEIPPREIRQGRRVGDTVKVILEVPAGAPARSHSAERPWFIIKEVREGPRYVGALANELVVFTELKMDDLVEFGPENIIAIWEEATKK